MARFKKSRGASFVIIALVYIICSIAGILLYRALPYPWWLRLLIADVAATVVCFLFSVIFGNASVYDPYWSVQPIVILAAYAAGTEMNPLRILLLLAVCLWGIRLTGNWAYTFHGLTHQDWRYTMLKKQTGRFYPAVNFVGIHLVPTLIVYGCTTPAVYAFLHDAPLNARSILFFCTAVCAVILQGTADWQMHAFRRSGTGGFNRGGLWGYSRHPNYLGEILMWWSIALCVISSYPGTWYLCAGAAGNTVLFLTVSIPMMEKRQSAKEGFEEYRSQTRVLLPIKRR